MSTYLHDRLSKTLLQELTSGTWRDGQRFFSVRDIERLWQVSEPTIVSSLRYLTIQGLLRPRPRSGYYTTSGFQQKAQLLLRKHPSKPLPPPLTWQQKARQIQGILGGQLALLFAAPPDLDPFKIYKEMPAQHSGTIAQCAAAFAKESMRYDFTLSYFFHNGEADNAEWIRNQLSEGHFAGAAAFCRSNHKLMTPLLHSLFERHLPIVIMYDDCQGLPVNSINLNNVGAGYDAIRQLAKMGHKRITVLTPKKYDPQHDDRVRGCLLAAAELKARNLDVCILKLHPDKSVPVEIRRHFAQVRTRPTAVFATLSALIYPLLPLWERLRLTIPDSLSLLACSRKNSFQNLPVPIDTMNLNMAIKIGRTAARQLHQIQTGEALEKSILINVPYERRGSIRMLESE